MWMTRPLLQIKKLDNGKYTWSLYLSNNKRRPSCISPTQYDDAFKCRDRAKKFAAKFKGPLRLLDRENKLDEILVVDETRNEQMPDWMIDEE